ncbi:MAG: hypothetical protein PVH61_43310 [Candidatus Aminicenantes bacterium]
MTITMILFFVLPLVSQEDPERIVEEVSVNWWQVPVFAVDQSGNPVTDLEPGDIQVRLNGQLISSFILDKQSFTVTHREKAKLPDAVPAAKQPPMKKNKLVFLLFDRTLSDDTSIRHAKDIALKIVLPAQEDTRFFVLTIDPYVGLVYIGEGSGGNKDQLVELIKTKVKRRKNQRLVDFWQYEEEFDNSGIGKKIDDPGKGKGSTTEDTDIIFKREAAAKPFLRKSMGFFYAFETLYLFLNSIEDYKFIYLFTEGMSHSILTSGRGLSKNKGMYYYYFKKVAKYLNRCGALLFIINAMGVDQYHSRFSDRQATKISRTQALQGEDSLNILTRESGGTYLEGTHEKIVERLENMYYAYYEISFPDIPQLKGATRKVEVTSNRKGIKIHSLHTLEKRKHYADMNNLEKELLVLNLITQPQNTLTQAKITAYNARVEKTKKTKKNVTYTVSLPHGYLRQSIDLYKVWLAVNEQGAVQLEKMEKESLYPKKDRLKIQFKLTPDSEDKKQKKEKKEIGAETETYFVLVNRGPQQAHASVHGMELYEEDPELIAEEKKKTAEERKKGETISAEEMTRILQGAADYCQQLKQSAFHFYCREKILETRNPLTNSGPQSRARRKLTAREKGNYALRDMRDTAFTQVKSYVFGYRLIKQGDQIKEERDWISSGDNVKVHRDQVVKTNAFFSEKAVFAPITNLDRTRQEKYNFQFIRFDERNGRPAAVIEALPKDPVETATIYGTLWIDTEDFSILKIEADPKSIRGYKALKELAQKLRTRLYLSMEIDFDRQQKGIRFPTKISFLEKYKGGRIIYGYQRAKGWERTRTEFTYSHYRFFDVKTEVTVQKAVGDRQ